VGKIEAVAGCHYFYRAARQYIKANATRIATDSGTKWYKLSAVVVNVAIQGIANTAKKTRNACFRAPVIRDGAIKMRANTSWTKAAAATGTTANGPISADAFEVIDAHKAPEAPLASHEVGFPFASINLRS
jgi:hypothetical protein